MTELVTTLIAALAGGVGGLAAWWIKDARALRLRHDETLHKARFEAYRSLWRQLEAFALFAPEKPLHYADLAAVSTSMRKWYFEEGGLVMPTSTRNLYFIVQEALSFASAKGRSTEPLTLGALTTTAELDRLRAEYMLAESTLLAGHGDAADDCRRRLKAAIPRWTFDEPRVDFVRLQYLVSALRTAFVSDLDSRAPALLRAEA